MAEQRPGIRRVWAVLMLRGRDEAGFTLVECLWAIVLLMLVLGASGLALINNIHAAAASTDRVDAASLASQQMENTRALAQISCAWTPTLASCSGQANSLSIGTGWQTDGTPTVGGVTYTVEEKLSWLTKSGTASVCGSNGQGSNSPLLPPVLLDTVKVYGPQSTTTALVRAQTELTPPVGTFNSNSGNLDAAVIAANGSGQPNLTVTLTGPSPAATQQTVSTDDNGCALFPYLTPGTYTVSLATTGYVDNTENPTPSQTVTVNAGTTAAPQFDYDQSAQVNVSWQSSAPPATNLPVTVSNSGLPGTATDTFAQGATALQPLYPYSNGYQVWAGHCPDANPLAVNGSGSPLYSPQPGATQVSVNPGGTSAVSVPLYPLTVNVTMASTGTPLAGATLTATEVTPGDASQPCSGGETFGLSASNASGTSSTGMPLGEFKVTVSYPGRPSQTVNVDVTPSGTSASAAM